MSDIGIGQFVQAMGADRAWVDDEDLRGVPVILSRTEFVRKRKHESSREAHARPLRASGARRPRTPLPLLARYYMQDSSAFVIVEKFGGWIFDDPQWADDTDYIAEIVGQEAEHVCIRDLMCEPWMLEKLGTTIEHNQAFTLRSYLNLRELRPRRPWLPTLQGDAPEDYERHADMYERAGVDLAKAQLVGVGSVCKRKGAALRAAPEIFRRLKARGIRCHAFGFDVRGVELLANAGLLSFAGEPGVVSGDTRSYGAGAREKGQAAKRGDAVDPALYLLPGHDKPGPGRKTGHQNCGVGCKEWDLRGHARHCERIAEVRARYEAGPPMPAPRRLLPPPRNPAQLELAL